MPNRAAIGLTATSIDFAKPKCCAQTLGLLSAPPAATSAARAVQVSPCVVPGSASLLRNAIENVVRNAVRHTQENSEVEVSLLCKGGLAIITVRDWGAGVPEQVLGELFKPFYRVESARERGSGGVGLGLAITERVERAHGGAIEARNASGGGLEVEIRLPTEVGGKTAGIQ